MPHTILGQSLPKEGPPPSSASLQQCSILGLRNCMEDGLERKDAPPGTHLEFQASALVLRGGGPTRDYLGGGETREPYKEALGGSFLYFVRSVRSHYGQSWTF